MEHVNRLLGYPNNSNSYLSPINLLMSGGNLKGTHNMEWTLPLSHLRDVFPSLWTPAPAPVQLWILQTIQAGGESWR